MTKKLIRSKAAAGVVAKRPLWEKYGKTRLDWEIHKAEARGHMVERASQRAMITYGDLAARMITVVVEAHDQMLWELIGDVASDEAAGGRGLLSVIVVHKHGDMEPGPGFFELAKYFGRKTNNQTQCFIEEVKRVFAEQSIKRPK